MIVPLVTVCIKWSFTHSTSRDLDNKYTLNEFYGKKKVMEFYKTKK